jgi:hypothetical protein
MMLAADRNVNCSAATRLVDETETWFVDEAWLVDKDAQTKKSRAQESPA